MPVPLCFLASRAIANWLYGCKNIQLFSICKIINRKSNQLEPSPLISGKLVGDKGYICKELFQRLFVDGIQLITKLKSNMKGALTTMSDRLLTRKRAIIETVNDELKNIAQVEHSRHRTFDNFMVNLLGAMAAYCFFPKKPCIACERVIDNQLALF